MSRLSVDLFESKITNLEAIVTGTGKLFQSHQRMTLFIDFLIENNLSIKLNCTNYGETNRKTALTFL